ncbi:uncharacterized protein PHALS_14724 [Plasmopara halstedii]|uniref:Uncharacterized protein n=1 Tax=Plasmopara halstedii TaxID=4781 RepID=A0A0P1A4X4_PLAHL|nr:uncharacterized protein PHALS_14724 [Plasmopara halstedii]CEG35117.1 hypothetical protein PHALS_14724 [Plasmopara halstedii]|eukprot:XP_024571486.1 hypothetical protein PHALS_14724 [Plasmopara halstedii]
MAGLLVVIQDVDNVVFDLNSHLIYLNEHAQNRARLRQPCLKSRTVDIVLLLLFFAGILYVNI